MIYPIRGIPTNLSSKSLRILVSRSTDRVCICFFEKNRMTNKVAMIDIASPIPNSHSVLISDNMFRIKCCISEIY